MRINVGNLKTVLVPVFPLKQQEHLVDDLRRIEYAMAAAVRSIAGASALSSALQNIVFQNQP